MKEFYEKFPDFDWVYYVDIYEDLKKAGIDNEQDAISHYLNFGQYEKRKIYKVTTKQNNVTTKQNNVTTNMDTNKMNINNIDINKIFSLSVQCNVSEGLYMFESRFKSHFNLTSYKNVDEPCIFFGIYTNDDLKLLSDHKGLKIIVYGGSDVNFENKHMIDNIDFVKNLDNVISISISKCILNRLNSVGIKSIYCVLNLVDKNIFKPISNKTKSNKIFIFNGQTTGREKIYGEQYYKGVIKKLEENGHDFDFVFSNTLNEKYENMPNIYGKCFVMLRLTKYDGNANSVQECEAMNIPVVHNNSEYGIKWNTVNDVYDIILKLYD
jgi:hypothetical protein